MEHPEDPVRFRGDHPDAPSVWNTQAVRWCRDTNLFCLLTLQQGFFHAKSPKPTTFLLSGIPQTTARHLEVAYRTSELPRSGSIGLGPKGWNTSGLKEYTAQLCALIAALFQEWISAHAHYPVRSFDEVTDWVRELIVTEENSRDIFGPDFEPAACQLENL